MKRLISAVLTTMANIATGVAQDAINDARRQPEGNSVNTITCGRCAMRVPAAASRCPYCHRSPQCRD